MENKFKPTKLSQVSSVDKVTQIKEFLNEHFQIRVNIFDPQKSHIQAVSGTYKHAIQFKDIYLKMVECGINASEKLLRTILSSPNHITTYNPISEYFESIKNKYLGTSHIDILACHLQARNFGDHEDPDYYQKRLQYILKKWIVATAACALELRVNDVAIGFINAIEGSGKTSLIENLVPLQLREYYRLSEKDDNRFNIELEYSKNFILNFDEFVGIKRSNIELFKKMQSAKSIHIKHHGDTFYNTIPRIASASFTSNKVQELGGFLTHEMGYRRFGVIELDSIDKEYSKKINVDQIWSEALMLIDQNFEYIFNEEDYINFKQYNIRYLIQTSAYNLIKDNYEIPSNEAETILRTPMEILQDLRKSRKITSNLTNVTEISIGVALQALGFTKKGKKYPDKKVKYPYSLKQLY